MPWAAIGQIKDKKYADVLKDYSGEVVLVGINCEKGKKEEGHHCKIERVGCQGDIKTI